MVQAILRDQGSLQHSGLLALQIAFSFERVLQRMGHGRSPRFT